MTKKFKFIIEMDEGNCNRPKWIASMIQRMTQYPVGKSMIGNGFSVTSAPINRVPAREFFHPVYKIGDAIGDFGHLTMLNDGWACIIDKDHKVVGKPKRVFNDDILFDNIRAMLGDCKSKELPQKCLHVGDRIRVDHTDYAIVRSSVVHFSAINLHSCSTFGNVRKDEYCNRSDNNCTLDRQDLSRMLNDTPLDRVEVYI